MNLEFVRQREVRKRKISIISLICEEKWYRKTYLQHRESDVENKFMVTKQGREEWEERRD